MDKDYKHILKTDTQLSNWFKEKVRQGKSNFLNFDQFKLWYDNSEKVCHYCGLTEQESQNIVRTKLKSNRFPKNGIHERGTSRGMWLEIDRYQPDGKYEIPNIVLCCYFCNNDKSDIFNGDQYKIFMKDRISFLRQLLTIFVIAIFSSCQLIDNQNKQAIEVCQKAKIQLQSDNVFANLFLNAYGIGTNATWLDFANMMAKQDPNKKYDWHATKTDDSKFYVVDFVDEDKWGQHWEVDVEQKIVKNINQNEYLSRKYGFRRFDGNEEFEIKEVQKSELQLNKNYRYLEENSNSSICYLFKASVLNKTNNTITSATINGNLKLIFKEKTIEGEGNYESGFNSKISKDNPWKPNTTKDFYIMTKGIEIIYLNYIPDYIVFDITLKAEDPVGYSFDKDIADIDLKDTWTKFKVNPTRSTTNIETNNNFSKDNQIKLVEVNSNLSNASNTYTTLERFRMFLKEYTKKYNANERILFNDFAYNNILIIEEQIFEQEPTINRVNDVSFNNRYKNEILDDFLFILNESSFSNWTITNKQNFSYISITANLTTYDIEITEVDNKIYVRKISKFYDT
jgi:hypothetical protein